jgi:membrane protease YdiL (CAAX protease family)
MPVRADTPTIGRRELALWVTLLALPFYLNDFANIFIEDWRVWLAIDYLPVKLLPLALIIWLVRSGRLRAEDFGWRFQPATAFLASFLLLTIASTLIDQRAYGWIADWPGYKALGAMPDIGSPGWERFDLSAGLLLVGLLEELVFRAAMFSLLSRYASRPAAIIVISALAFGLIHWSLGLHSVVVTAVIGALFMAVYLRTRSLPALVLAHFVIDYIAFSGS